MAGKLKSILFSKAFIFGAFAFCIPLSVYFLTLAPTVFNLDSAELTTAAATGGLTRATGYPLYLTVGWLWSKLPIGDVGYRMNLFSAVCASLTLLLCERILARQRVRVVARLSAIGVLAFSKYFWQLSLIAEVYTLQLVIIAGLVLAIISWSENPSPFRFGLIGFCIGLGFSHHMSIVLLIPGVIFYFSVSQLREIIRKKYLATGLIGVVIGLLFYLYLPLRYLAEPAFNYAGFFDGTGEFHASNLTSVQGVWQLVTGNTFSSLMFAYPLSGSWQELLRFITLLAISFLGFGLGPGVLGLWYSIRRHWKFGILLALMFGGHAIFYINYRAIDKELMYLPVYLVWALWIGYGYELLLDWNDRDPLLLLLPMTKKPVNLASLILSCLMVVGIFCALVFNWSLVDLSKDRSARIVGEEILELLPPNAIFFGYWDTVPAVQYLQLVEKQRPDVVAINRFLISSENLVQWIQNDLGAVPIYIDAMPAQLLGETRPIPTGPIIFIQPLRLEQ